jgi:hypothetical protein
VIIRQLGRKSFEDTGVSPKTLVRIARFQPVLKMKKRRFIKLERLTRALEYYEQMHMICDFRAVAGTAP